MTGPDPVTDVWELLLYAACDYRDANPRHRSEARLIDALMPIVHAYGDAMAARELEAEAAYDDAAPDEQYPRRLFAQRLRARAKNLRDCASEVTS